VSRGWLIVFAKAPRPGLVKTRMSPPLSLDQAAELYEAMLTDSLDASLRFAKALDLLPVVAFYPLDAAGEFIGRAPAGFRLQAQRGSDLADRMANAFAEAAAAGAERILLRGTDSPALGLDAHQAVMDGLDAGDDLVLTPDQAGGYTLIGMRTSRPSVFELPMSTDAVMEQTLEAARSMGLQSSLTSASFDLDTVGDFHCFDALSAAQKLDLCPRTVESISSAAIRAVL
jgi:rSAM/selenodomain-associated transferase 1